MTFHKKKQTNQRRPEKDQSRFSSQSPTNKRPSSSKPKAMFSLPTREGREEAGNGGRAGHSTPFVVYVISRAAKINRTERQKYWNPMKTREAASQNNFKHEIDSDKNKQADKQAAKQTNKQTNKQTTDKQTSK